MTNRVGRGTAMAMWLVLALSAPASGEPVACKRAIATAGAALGGATMQALAKCERREDVGRARLERGLRDRDHDRGADRSFARRVHAGGAVTTNRPTSA